LLAWYQSSSCPNRVCSMLGHCTKPCKVQFVAPRQLFEIQCATMVPDAQRVSRRTRSVWLTQCCTPGTGHARTCPADMGGTDMATTTSTGAGRRTHSAGCEAGILAHGSIPDWGGAKPPDGCHNVRACTASRAANMYAVPVRQASACGRLHAVRTSAP
jgi:hypothetical protein